MEASGQCHKVNKSANSGGYPKFYLKATTSQHVSSRGYTVLYLEVLLWFPLKLDGSESQLVLIKMLHCQDLNCSQSPGTQDVFFCLLKLELDLILNCVSVCGK
ncbi:Hypothetical predicted protein [Podarcis lilfordi]|uniref:Uncharacterized protein n=1 Tax=Podarcis lilfordi TaxID=74358 RepID=A0AA35LLY3_9SAUR|nr:Hypothetical predicted protein [Podarcis lilfordi]